MKWAPVTHVVSMEGRRSAKARGAVGLTRVLIVSADMGGGHNAAGRAVQESVEHAWPDAEVHWVDALAAVGHGVGPALRGLYVLNVQRTPWLYRLFYASLWRYRWFSRASKAVVGAVFGRRLRPVVDQVAPDVIVSTYPMGSAGLVWLRRRGLLTTPCVAVVSDVAPHPFWVYADLDLTLVVHSQAVPVAQAAEPGATVEAGPLPVCRAFQPGDKGTARRRLGLPEDRFVALVSCGSYGFGAVTEAAQALLEVGPDVLPVVVCGRNERLAARLRSLGHPEARLRIVGWTDDMATWTRTADVVVTNAGGVTALEAIATGRPLVMYRPIAAHGEANAALLVAAGIAARCDDPGQLIDAVRALTRGETVTEAPASPPGGLAAIVGELAGKPSRGTNTGRRTGPAVRPGVTRAGSTA
jgi:UDP-N-acetylglucosamine:LPS N-acetylglucosamine transferase